MNYHVLKLVYDTCVALREQYPCDPLGNDDEANFLLYLLKNAQSSNSQLFQDIWVLYETRQKKSGYFVEFGACNGKTLSNSFILEKQHNWNGIVAEPGKIWRSGIIAERNCIVSTKCIYTTTGEIVTFNETPNAELSTIESYSESDSHAVLREQGEKHLVETIRLGDLLRQSKAPNEIDYLSIDTEGSEFDILLDHDFEEYRFNLISVEHNGTENREKIFELLTSKGYRRKFTRLSIFDDWYVRADYQPG